MWISDSSLRTHALTHLPIERRPVFECYMCKRIYHCKDSLRNHWPVHVSGRKRFKCTQCDKDFGRKDSLRRHEGIHKGEFLFHCIECGKKFRSKKSLQVCIPQFYYRKIVGLNGKNLKCYSFHFQCHKNIHSNLKPFGCPIENCEYRCSDSSNVFKHIRQKHGKARSNSKSNCVQFNLISN